MNRFPMTKIKIGQMPYLHLDRRAFHKQWFLLVKPSDIPFSWLKQHPSWQPQIHLSLHLFIAVKLPKSQNWLQWSFQKNFKVPVEAPDDFELFKSQERESFKYMLSNTWKQLWKNISHKIIDISTYFVKVNNSTLSNQINIFNLTFFNKRFSQQ